MGVPAIDIMQLCDALLLKKVNINNPGIGLEERGTV